MWEVKETIAVDSESGPMVQLMLDHFKPHPGFTYVGRTVIVRQPLGSEYPTTLDGTRDHGETWSFLLPVTTYMAPPGSYVRFLHHGVDVR